MFFWKRMLFVAAHYTAWEYSLLILSSFVCTCMTHLLGQSSWFKKKKTEVGWNSLKNTISVLIRIECSPWIKWNPAVHFLQNQVSYSTGGGFLRTVPWVGWVRPHAFSEFYHATQTCVEQKTSSHEAKESLTATEVAALPAKYSRWLATCTLELTQMECL